MTAKSVAPRASFVVRCFLALHATVPAAVLVAVLVHLWPPAGLPPLAQRPLWAVWTLIGTWLAASLIAAWALRHLALWRVSLGTAGALLVLAGATGLLLGAPLQWPMLAGLVALGGVLAGLAAFIDPARVQANRRREGSNSSSTHPTRRSARRRWPRRPAKPSTQALSFWLAALLAAESLHIALATGEPARGAGMLGLLTAFFLVLPAATLQAWWPRAAAVLAALAAAALAWLAWRSGMAVWGIAAALCLAMGIAVLRRLHRQGQQRRHNATPVPGAQQPVEGSA